MEATLSKTSPLILRERSILSEARTLASSMWLCHSAVSQGHPLSSRQLHCKTPEIANQPVQALFRMVTKYGITDVINVGSACFISVWEGFLKDIWCQVHKVNLSKISLSLFFFQTGEITLDNFPNLVISAMLSSVL